MSPFFSCCFPCRYTFVEDVRNPHSCTILLKGPNEHTIAQLKDAVRDGMRAVLNVLEDGAIVAGAGAFELAAAAHLQEHAKREVSGKAKLGVLAFADALLVVPKTLAENSGFDISVSLLLPFSRGTPASTAHPSFVCGCQHRPPSISKRLQLSPLTTADSRASAGHVDQAARGACAHRCKRRPERCHWRSHAAGTDGRVG